LAIPIGRADRHALNRTSQLTSFAGYDLVVADEARVGCPSDAVRVGVDVLAASWTSVEDAMNAAGDMRGRIGFTTVNSLKPVMSGRASGKHRFPGLQELLLVSAKDLGYFEPMWSHLLLRSPFEVLISRIARSSSGLAVACSLRSDTCR
jgi:hypothetical protein